jgi:hypothetical protein
MNLSIQDWGAIGELVGGAAVIVTLIYLAMQLRQNTASVQSASLHAWNDAIADCIMPVCESKDLSDVITRGIQDSKNLSEETWVQFILWHQQLLYTVQCTWLAHKKGNIEQLVYEQEIERAVSVLKWPESKQWWDAGGRNQVSSEFAVFLESQIDERKSFAGILWDKEQGFYTDH